MIIYFLIGIALGGLIASAPLFSYMLLQQRMNMRMSYFQADISKQSGETQVKINESYLPIKQEETKQLRIVQEREYNAQTFQEKMNGGDDV